MGASLGSFLCAWQLLPRPRADHTAPGVTHSTLCKAMYLSSWNLPGAGRLVWNGGHMSPHVVLCLVRKRGASGKVAWNLVMEQDPSLCSPPPARALAPQTAPHPVERALPEAAGQQSSFPLFPLAGLSARRRPKAGKEAGCLRPSQPAGLRPGSAFSGTDGLTQLWSPQQLWP